MTNEAKSTIHFPVAYVEDLNFRNNPTGDPDKRRDHSYFLCQCADGVEYLTKREWWSHVENEVALTITSEIL